MSSNEAGAGPPAAHRAGPIVVGVDGSDGSKGALDWAAREAARRRGSLRIVHAFLWPATGLFLGPSALGPPEGGLRNLAEELLADAAAAAHAIAPEIAVSTELHVSGESTLLINESRSAAMVVVGSRGLGGFTGLLVGSVAVQVSAHAQCPVVVVRGEAGPPGGEAPRPVVVGVDGSAGSEAALDFAFEEASLRRAGLTVVHAWTVPAPIGPKDVVQFGYDPDEVSAEQTRLLAESLAGWQAKYPDVAVQRVVAHGAPAEKLVEASAGADLLVVGSRGRGGFRGLLLGSVSQAMLHHAHCPVAVVRAPSDATDQS